MVAFATGIAASDPLRLPGEDVVAAILAGVILTALCALVDRAAESGTEPPGRARAEGWSARNDLLFSAAFATFAVLYSVDSLGEIPLLAPLPALLVALMFAVAAVRRSSLLRLAGLFLGGMYVLTGVLVSLAGTFG